MSRSHSIPGERSGFVLLVTMLALLIVVSLLGTLLDGTRQRHSHLRLRQQVRQAEQLLAAGRDLARHRLQEHPDYRGETWEPVLEEGPPALVEVTVDHADDQAGVLVAVSVVLKPEEDHPVRRSGRFVIPVKQSLTGEEN